MRAEGPPGALRVTRLGLVDRGLTGFIPPAIGRLTWLRWLWLGGNQLSGELPAELGDLAEMRLLSLHTNDFTGEIPAELGRLSNMYAMSLEYNRLTGAIPPELTGMKRLEGLWLNGNSFEGCIPPHVAREPGRPAHAGNAGRVPVGRSGASVSTAAQLTRRWTIRAWSHDCSVLLEVKDKLGADAALNWSEALALDHWGGRNRRTKKGPAAGDRTAVG